MKQIWKFPFPVQDEFAQPMPFVPFKGMLGFFDVPNDLVKL